MADQKLTALVELVTVVNTDILYVVDDPGGAPLSRKITRTNLLGSGLTDIVALDPTQNDNFIVADGANWAQETPAEVRTTLGLVIGTNVQAFDIVLDDLSALAAVADDEFIVGTGAGIYAHEAASTLPATIGGVIQDLDTLGAAGADGEFIVATGVGAFAYESGATVRTSLGLVAGGAGDIWVEKAGDIMTGALTVDGTADVVQLTVQGHSTQNNNLQEWQNSGGTPLAFIEETGRFESDVGTTSTNLCRFIGSLSGGIVTGQFQNDAAANTGNNASFGFRVNSSTTLRQIFRFDASLSDITDATRTSKIRFQVNDNSSFVPAFEFIGRDASFYNSSGQKHFLINKDSSVVMNERGLPAGDVRIEGDTNTRLFQTDASADRVGINLATPLAKLHIDQSSTTAAIPVLYLDQADVSEEFIEFNTTIGEGNAIEAVGAKSLTTTHFLKVNIPGGGTHYIPVGTIA